MAASDGKKIKDVATVIEQLTVNPGEFLSAEKSRDSKLTKSLKNLFDSAKGFIKTDKSLDSLPELIISGFDDEQIWQQIELENESNISSLLSTCSRVLSKKSALTFKCVNNVSSELKPNKLTEKSDNLRKINKTNKSDKQKKTSVKEKQHAKDVDLEFDDVENESDGSGEEIAALEKRYETTDQNEEDDKFFDFTGDSDEDLNFDFGPMGQNDDSDEEMFKGDDSDDDELNGDKIKKKKKSVTFEDSESKIREVGKKNKAIGRKTKSLLKNSNKQGSVVDDKFFKLSQLEEFLDQEDRKEERRLKREKSGKKFDDDDDFEDNDNDEEINLFADIDSDEENCHYEDFFDPPEDADDAASDNKDKQNVMNEEEEFYDGDNDDGDLDGKAGMTEDSQRGHRDLLADSDSEGEDVADILGGKKNKKSSYEIRQEKLKKKISAMEEEMLSEKPWQMGGEVTAGKRPENSLLQERLQFEQTTRLPPEITEETTKSLEDLVRQRIKDKAWDDVERKVKPIDNPFEYKKRITLDQEKSKMSLGEIYEQEYLKQQQTEEVEKKDPDHEDIKKSLQSLFIKLDALSNFHYTPKQATAEIVVVTNQPSITIEEVAPVSMSDSKTLAPEEIKDKLNDEIKGATEKTKTDRTRERKKKKKQQRVREKEKEKRQKLVDKLNPGLGNKYSKERALKQIEKASKSGNSGLTMLKEDRKGRSELTSSRAFFTQLQEEVVTNIHRKSGDKRKKDSNLPSVKKLKL